MEAETMSLTMTVARHNYAAISVLVTSAQVSKFMVGIGTKLLGNVLVGERNVANLIMDRKNLCTCRVI
jgi:hypothetical protein